MTPLHQATMKKYVVLLGLITGVLSVSCQKKIIAESGREGAQTHEELRQGFANPPNSAKPRVWWHWMNGNISKEGIKKDLEWMHRIGIGGFQNFDAGLLTPQIVDKRLTYMTPEWKEAFAYATQLADSLGLEMAIAGSPGWSESGGPWVEAKDGMKKLVWSENRIEGGRRFNGTLPKPPSVTGIFQNVKYEESLGLSERGPAPPDYYKDYKVLAYQLSSDENRLGDLKPGVSSTGGSFDLDQLTDGDLETSTFLPPKEVGEYMWIQYAFDEPVTVNALTLVGGGQLPEFGAMPANNVRTLEISEDGKNFEKLMDLPLGKLPQRTYSINPVSAKYFRFNFLTEATKVSLIAAIMGGPQTAPKPEGVEIAEIDLHTVQRIGNFEEKAGFGVERNYKGFYDDVTHTTQSAIALEEVIDLTDRVDAQGRLNWEVPTGNWNVICFGYSLTGRQNHPASPEATGLEVDKLDPVAVKAYIENYLDQYQDATGGLMGDEGGLQYIVMDSWEAGVQNWTAQMPKEFEKRRGYSLVQWMPVLTGKVVQSAEASERFLWDFRRTIGEMIKEYHYDVLSEALHARGMGRYTESHESGRAYVGDGMAIKSTADIPMSAMWTPGGIGGPEEDGPAVRSQADIRESASTAHIYGQNFVAAESMTAIGNAFAFSPERLKSTADMELASGLNRFVIHTSVHQPVDDKIPGLGLGPFGQWFTRHETWAEKAKPWMDYLARSSYLLQQGDFVADVVYFYGQDNNITALYADTLPAVPSGYNYDFINADAVREELFFKDGYYRTKSGMKYKVFALDENSRHMTLDVLNKIADFAKRGGTIVGPKPLRSPSLVDDPKEFARLRDEVWGGNYKNVLTGSSILTGLQRQNLRPDFEYTSAENRVDLRYVHRSSDAWEIYWINNRNKERLNIEGRFRVTGRKPEIWNPQTGKIKEVSYTSEEGVTTIPLDLAPEDALFIVFGQKTDVGNFSTPSINETVLSDVAGPWEVTFQPGRGAPESATFNQLRSLSEHSDPGIKYFSGTASYSHQLSIDQSNLNSGNEIWLDLGGVKNLAEIFVNGRSQGIVWKRPFEINITGGLKAGENVIRIEVTNLWVNRLIGDAQSETKEKITYTALPFYKQDNPLLPSGLIGPVKLISRTAN